MNYKSEDIKCSEQIKFTYLIYEYITFNSCKYQLD